MAAGAGGDADVEEVSTAIKLNALSERKSSMMEPEDDLFGGIVMSEERYHGEGYEEGFAEGNRIGETEGKQYGAVYGAKMGSELGCYLGFASTWRLLLSPITDEKQSKKIKTLDSLIKMIESFPSDDPTNERLQEELSRIRGKVKQGGNPEAAVADQ